MSRTFRNRPHKLISSDSDAIWLLECYNEDKVKRLIWKHYCDSVSGRWSLPKHFRKRINKHRKQVDKRELSCILKDIEYIPNMSPWNGRDSRAWDWF